MEIKVSSVAVAVRRWRACKIMLLAFVSLFVYGCGPVYISQWLAQKYSPPPTIDNVKFGAALTKSGAEFILELCLLTDSPDPIEVAIASIEATTSNMLKESLPIVEAGSIRKPFVRLLGGRNFGGFPVAGGLNREVFLKFTIPPELKPRTTGYFWLHLTGLILEAEGRETPFDVWIAWRTFRRGGVYFVVPGGGSDLFGRTIHVMSDDFGFLPNWLDD